jgi:hypothetical protein
MVYGRGLKLKSYAGQTDNFEIYGGPHVIFSNSRRLEWHLEFQHVDPELRASFLHPDILYGKLFQELLAPE